MILDQPIICILKFSALRLETSQFATCKLQPTSTRLHARCVLPVVVHSAAPKNAPFAFVVTLSATIVLKVSSEGFTLPSYLPSGHSNLRIELQNLKAP